MTLTDDDFALVRAYLAEAAGLVFDHSRRPGLTGVLAERLGSTGSPDVAAYVALLRSPGGEAERQRDARIRAGFAFDTQRATHHRQ